MATQKSRKKSAAGEPAAAPRSEGYDQALTDYARGLELTHAGDYTAALELFEKVSSGNPDEPELAERARAHAAVCSRKLATVPERPTTAEGLYHLGVIRANDGRLARPMPPSPTSAPRSKAIRSCASRPATTRTSRGFATRRPSST